MCQDKGYLQGGHGHPAERALSVMLMESVSFDSRRKPTHAACNKGRENGFLTFTYDLELDLELWEPLHVETRFKRQEGQWSAYAH